MTSSCPFDIVPYDQSGIIKTPNLINVNYTCQDFWSLKGRLRDFIKQRAGDQFNDFVESSLAIMLIENWAFCADLLSFKLDQIANEIFIDTVSQVENAFRLSNLVGFQPTPPIAASSMWSATIANLLDTDLPINTPVSIDITTESGPDTIELFPMDVNGNPMLNDQIIISAGSFVNTTIIGLEGKTRVQGNTGSGQMNQFYQLSYGPVIWGSVRLDVDGVSWNQVDYFTDGQPRPEYLVQYDSNYNAYIMFGNNQAGMIPSLGSQIQVTYRTGGGVSGNIVAGTVSIQRNYIIPNTGFRSPVTFTNYTSGQFGYDGDTIDDIKQKLPAYLRSQNRAVSSDDYTTITNQFATPYNGQIGKATAVLRNYGCSGNIIDVYILALNGTQGLQEANNDLKVALMQYMNTVKMMTDFVCIKDGEVINVDVYLDLVLDKYYRKFEDEYLAKVQSALTTFFSLNNWNYSQDLNSLDLVKQLSSINEIKTTTVNFVTSDPNNSGDSVSTLFYQIIRPANTYINFSYV